MPMHALRRLAIRLPQMEAQQELRLLNLHTFIHWSGQSSGKISPAQREGNRKRRKYVQDRLRVARGLGRYDEIPGVDYLRNSSEVRAWFGAHGVAV